MDKFLERNLIYQKIGNSLIIIKDLKNKFLIEYFYCLINKTRSIEIISIVK